MLACADVLSLQYLVVIGVLVPACRQVLLDVSGQVPPEVITALHTVCKTPGFDRMQKAVASIIAEGYAAQQVLLQLQVRRDRQVNINTLMNMNICDSRKGLHTLCPGPASYCCVWQGFCA